MGEAVRRHGSGHTRRRRPSDRIRSALAAALLISLSLTLITFLVAPSAASAQSGSNELDIVLSFPDGGLADGEQLCLALFPNGTTDFSTLPLQSRCLDPGDDTATFAGITPGTYQLITPSVGSVIDQDRYQVQAAETSIPADASDASFSAKLPLALSPEVAGTTGQVQLNVYGCPPGTDGQGDATLWQSQCTSPVAGVSLELQGIGSIGDTSREDVTSTEQATAGKVAFTGLPPGDYELVGLNGDQFTNVAANPALVIESSIDGSLGVIDPSEEISLRPSEVKNINIYLVLTDDAAPMVISPIPATVAIGAPTGTFDSANPSTAASDLGQVQVSLLPVVAGGLTAEEAANRASDAAPVVEP